MGERYPRAAKAHKLAYSKRFPWLLKLSIICKVAYTIVDKIHYKTPALQKDPYWDEVVPAELPHTIASMKSSRDAPSTSTAKLVVSSKDKEIVLAPSLINIATISKTNIKFRRADAKGENKRRLLKEKSEAIKEYEDATAGLEDSEDEVKIVTVKT